MRVFCFLISAWFLAACTHEVENHGWVGDFREIDDLTHGVAYQKVLEKLGSPTLVSLERVGQIYYVRYVTIKRTTLLNRLVLPSEGRCLSFNKEGFLISVERFENQNPGFEPDAYKTENSVAFEWSAEQVFRNLGQQGGGKGL